MEVLAQLKAILAIHEKYSNAYFFRPESSASGRRRAEFDNTHELIVGGNKLVVRQTLTQSCKNVYFKTRVELNGKPTDIRGVKKMIALLEAN